MILLAHRGHWRTAAEKNSLHALREAAARGAGIETDLRDCGSRLVISHDIAPPDALSFEHLLESIAATGKQPMLALNIKADGLCELLRQMLAHFGVTRYFCFDMSVPDTLPYLKAGMTVFTRRSEFEPGGQLDSRAQGLWLDAFEQEFVPPSLLEDILAEARTAALVSPELHGRPHLDAWAAWREVIRRRQPAPEKIMLCTDLVDEAEVFFQGC
jgi:glycerophosphoryl diester phosphodiesterase